MDRDVQKISFSCICKWWSGLKDQTPPAADITSKVCNVSLKIKKFRENIQVASGKVF